MSFDYANYINSLYLRKLFGIGNKNNTWIELSQTDVTKTVESIIAIDSIGSVIKLVSESDPNNFAAIDSIILYALSGYVSSRSNRVLADKMTDDIQTITLNAPFLSIYALCKVLTRDLSDIIGTDTYTHMADIYYLMDYLDIDQVFVDRFTSKMIKAIPDRPEYFRDKFSDQVLITYANIKYKFKGSRMPTECIRYLKAIEAKTWAVKFLGMEPGKIFEKLKTMSLVLFMTKHTRVLITALVASCIEGFRNEKKWIEQTSKLIKCIVKKFIKLQRVYQPSMQKIITQIFQVIPWQDLCYDMVIEDLQLLTKVTGYSLPTEMAKRLHLRKCLEGGVKKFHGRKYNGFYVDSDQTIETFGLTFNFDSKIRIKKMHTSYLLSTSSHPLPIKMTVKEYSKKKKFRGETILTRNYSICMSYHTDSDIKFAVKACMSYTADDGRVEYFWWVFKPFVKQVRQETIDIRGKIVEHFVEKSMVSALVIKTTSLKLQFHTLEVIPIDE